MNTQDPTWHSQVEEAQTLTNDQDIRWDDSADVVVVGYGLAGISAALQAREQGLDVIAIDRFGGGGTSVLSGGVYYAGGGTQIQQDLGETDSPEAMYEYLQKETGDVVQRETLRRFCQESPANLEWLQSHGVKFSGPVYKEKTSYPNTNYFLYHSDNSLLDAYKGHHPSAARGHRGLTKITSAAINLGGAIYWPMQQSAAALGVRVRLFTEGRSLVLNEAGDVLGIKVLCLDERVIKRYQKYEKAAKFLAGVYPPVLPGGRLVYKMIRHYRQKAKSLEDTHRKEVYLRARKGVVLASGGFIYNRKMVKTHCPVFATGMPLGTAADDGSGIRLGQTAGAATRLMDHATAWRFINPPLAWSRGMMVNSEGARFTNESAYGATLGSALVAQSGARAWLILDKHLVRQAWYQIRPGQVLTFQRQLVILNHLFAKKRYANTKALCKACNFNLSTFEENLNAYNRLAQGELSDPLGKARADASELTPPFHVIDVSLAQRLLPCSVLTMGGLDVNEATGQVLHTNKTPIPGLYAAGRTAVGIPSHLYVSGLSLADCVFSGRRAARHLVSLLS